MVKKTAARSGKFKRSQTEAQEISQLEERIQQLQAEPAASTSGAGSLTSLCVAIKAVRPIYLTVGHFRAGLSSFEDLPLSAYTLEGLRAAKYTQLTAIQRAALPSALAGRDVLGAAKTGSGKTLAFLVPVRTHALCAGRICMQNCGCCMWGRLCPCSAHDGLRHAWHLPAPTEARNNFGRPWHGRRYESAVQHARMEKCRFQQH